MEPEKTPLASTPTDSQPANPSANTDAGVSADPAGTTIKPTSSIPDEITDAPKVATPLPQTEPDMPEVPLNPLPLGNTTSKPAKKGLILGLIVAAGVLLLSGAAAASYYYVANKPENVLKKALAQSFDTTKAKTVQFSGAVQLKTESGSFSIDLKGSGDNQTGAFDVTTTIDALVTKLTVDTRSVDGKTFYLRVGGLQGLSSLLSSSMADQSVAAYGPMIETLNNQWFEINESLISQFTKGQTIQPLSQADRDKLVAAYQQHTFLVVKQKLADEVVKGTKSYHYKVAIDNVQLKAFFAAVKTANLSSMKLTDEQLQSIDQSIDQAKLDQLDVEVWVAKSTKMLDQVTLSFTEGKSAVNVRLTIDSYNKEVKVEKPADAKSLLEVISGLLTGGTLPTGELPNGISL